MKRREFVTAVPALLAIAACGDSGPTGGGGNPGPPPPPPPPPPSTGADVDFTIVDNAFVDPSGGRNAAASVTINSGETVGWVHTGANSHTVTSTSVPGGAQAFASGNLNNNDTFTVTLSVVGTYVFRCDFHPQIMVDAEIIVQ